MTHHPSADRREWLLDDVAPLERLFAGTGFTRLGAGPFRAYVAQRRLSTMVIEGIAATPYAVRRDAVDAERSQGHVLHLYVVVEGSGSVTLAGSTFDAATGDMFMRWTDTPYSYRCRTTTKTFRATVATELLPPNLRDRYEPPPAPLPRTVATTAFRRLAQDLLAGAPPNALSVAATVHLEHALIALEQSILAEQLAAQLMPADRHAELRQEVLDHIDLHLRDPDLTPQVLADRFAISLRLLHKLFETTPETAAHRIRRRRIEEAAAILRNRDVAVGELAAQLGFGSVSTFQRAFTRQQGVSPQHYRASLLRPPPGPDGTTLPADRVDGEEDAVLDPDRPSGDETTSVDRTR